MEELSIVSTLDGSLQPSLFYSASGIKPEPLLVGLHTWSGDRWNMADVLMPLAREMNWNLLLPEFRGPNTVSNPQANLACGSVYAKQDIVDAVESVKLNNNIDQNNILLLRGSGGGHMALLMAAYAYRLWKAVAAFVPITDLNAWYHENNDYMPHVEYCCGGKPEGAALKEYADRSPVSYTDDIAKGNVAIFHGKFDNVVPYTHSTVLYGQICRKYPEARVFLDIFDGGHQIVVQKAKDWFLQQLALPI